MYDRLNRIIRTSNSFDNNCFDYTYESAENLFLPRYGMKADTNPFRYCGEYFDEETGFVYLRARYYSPDIGRFVSEDPIKDGNNWYVYCGNSPIMYADFSGKTIVLSGIEDKNDERLIALQKLTDDILDVDFKSYKVSIKMEIDDEHMYKPSGTSLIREIINNLNNVEVLITKDVSKTYTFQNKENNIIIEYNPNQSGNVPVISVVSKDGNETKMSETPNYIILGHELIHSYRMINGNSNNQKAWIYPLWERKITLSTEKGYANTDYVEELETVGLPYTIKPIVNDDKTISKNSKYVNSFVKYKYTENALRVENLLPIRMRYHI